MKEKIKSACPLNCFDVCGLEVTLENNKIIDINGDNEHPITKGKICIKGKMLKDRIYHTDRLKYPLKKVEDNFVRISWDKALSEISKKMKEVKKNYGPTAILHSYDYSSAGLLKSIDQRFFDYFGGYTEVKGSLCWGAGIKAQYYDFGDSLSNDVTDIINAKTIIIWGRNITTTNLHLYNFILEAQKNGTKIIVIDPIKTNILSIADEYIQIKPGMDGNLALVISKIIIDNYWIDKEFIEKNTIGFAQFMETTKKIDVNKISKEINIDYKTIYKLAKIIAYEKPVMSFLGLGMQRYRNGGNTIRAIDALFALTGNIGFKGSGVNFANLAVGKSFNWKDLIREDVRTDYREFYRPTQADEILKANNPPIKMIFVTRSNPITQLPNINKTLEAFNSVDTLIVFDMYMTDTAKQADYILPIASVFEEEDIYYGSMFHGVVRYGPKIIEPEAEIWSELEIWNQLAIKLELNGFVQTREQYFETALKLLVPYGITLNKLKNNMQISLPISRVPWDDFKFKTPSGKFEFYSSQAEKDSLSPIAIIDYPDAEKEIIKKDKEYLYYLLSIHPTHSLHSQHQFILNKKNGNVIKISQKIADDKNIKNGDMIKINNEKGTIHGVAKISDNIHQDVIVIEEGEWLNSNFSVNLLTSNKSSDMGNGSILYDCKVNIIKY